MRSPTALTRFLLTYWISLPRLKQGLWLIVKRSHGFMMTLKKLRCQRRRLEKRAVKTDLPGDWNNYHNVRNQYFAFLKSARVNYYSNLIDQCAGESRKLFRVVNSLCREPLETALPEHTDHTTVASTVKEMSLSLYSIPASVSITRQELLY